MATILNGFGDRGMSLGPILMTPEERAALAGAPRRGAPAPPPARQRRRIDPERLEFEAGRAVGQYEGAAAQRRSESPEERFGRRVGEARRILLGRPPEGRTGLPPR